VTGIDRSPDMMRVAQGINPDVEYVEGDIRTARLGRKFDAVLSHDAIAYMLTQEDIDEAYRTAAAHLNPGGIMVALPEEVRAFFKQNRIDHSVAEREGKTVATIEVAHDPDPADETFETTFVYVIRENGKLTIETDTHILGIHPLEAFTGALDRAGFDFVVEEWELSDVDKGYPLITAVLR
jgi:SAM-dependent methyltransferase